MKFSIDTLKVFCLEKEGVSFFLDKNSNLYWSANGTELMALQSLPWDYQLPFYLTFLHNDVLAERFKNMKILGAIDLYIKNHYFFGEKTTAPPVLRS